MKKTFCCLFSTLLISSSAHAALVWQPAPADGGAAGSGHMSHGGGHGGKPFLLSDAKGAEAELWLPTRVRRPLPVSPDGRVTVKGTGLTSYHLLFARKESDNREEVAMRYISQHGKPSGESPAALVNAGKAALDITPAPLTREHQRYTSLKPFDFIVTFNGEPLASKAVELSTSNGTRINGQSDDRGRVRFYLPDDFSDVEPGRANNRPADFVVSAAHSEADKAYHTTLSAPYFVSPTHWQSTAGGLAAMFAGMVTGLVVLKRSRAALDSRQGRG